MPVTSLIHAVLYLLVNGNGVRKQIFQILKKFELEKRGFDCIGAVCLKIIKQADNKAVLFENVPNFNYDQWSCQ